MVEVEILGKVKTRWKTTLVYQVRKGSEVKKLVLEDLWHTPFLVTFFLQLWEFLFGHAFCNQLIDIEKIDKKRISREIKDGKGKCHLRR